MRIHNPTTLTERALDLASKLCDLCRGNMRFDPLPAGRQDAARELRRYSLAVNRLTERYYREQSRHNESGRT